MNRGRKSLKMERMNQKPEKWPSVVQIRAVSSRCLVLILTAAFLLFPPSVSPQAQPEISQDQQEILRYEVSVTLKLIQVYVMDKKEKPVADLTSADFEIFDNGKPQEITQFEKHILSLPQGLAPKTEPSASTGALARMNRKFFLFFDFAFNNPGGISLAQKAALHFIDTQIFPTDEIGVLSFSVDKGLTLHIYLTQDHARVRETVGKVGLGEALGKAGGLLEELEGDTAAGGAGGSMRSGLLEQAQERMQEVAGRMQLANQVFTFSQAIENLAKSLRYIPGYKNIILFSTGIPGRMIYESPGRGSARTDPYNLRTKYEEMSLELGAANSPVFSVNVEGLGTISAATDFAQLRRGAREIDIPGPSRSLEDAGGRNALKQLASLSGGKYFGNINNYEKVVEEIQELTGSYYVLGYSVDEKWDGAYHSIKVEVKRKGCTANAQKGYFNPKPFREYTEFEKRLHLVDLALNENPYFEEPVRFPLIALPSFVMNKSTLTMIGQLAPGQMGEVLEKNAEIVSLVFDEQKNLAGYQRRPITLPALAQNIIYYHSVSSLPPGPYECRVVIRNLETGRGAVGSSAVNLPKPLNSGLRLYPPLLLLPETNTQYLKGSEPEQNETGKEHLPLDRLYPFDTGHYAPVVQEIGRGAIPRILAVLRCSIIDYPEAAARISARLIDLSSGKEAALLTVVLDQSEQDENKIYLLELETGELKPGKYALYLTASDMNANPVSTSSATFIVK